MSHSRELVRVALTRLFDAYMAATGETPTVVSRRFASDGSFYARLPDHRPTHRKAEIIVRQFSDAWPANLAWPADVPALEVWRSAFDVRSKANPPDGEAAPSANP